MPGQHGLYQQITQHSMAQHSTVQHSTAQHSTEDDRAVICALEAAVIVTAQYWLLFHDRSAQHSTAPDGIAWHTSVLMHDRVV